MQLNKTVRCIIKIITEFAITPSRAMYTCMHCYRVKLIVCALLWTAELKYSFFFIKISVLFYHFSNACFQTAFVPHLVISYCTVVWLPVYMLSMWCNFVLFCFVFAALFVFFIFDGDGEAFLHLCATHEMQIKSAISFQHRIKSHEYGIFLSLSLSACPFDAILIPAIGSKHE